VARGRKPKDAGQLRRRVGIDLGDVVVRRPATLVHFQGRRLAVDAWNILYQFLSSIRGPDGAPLTDASGQVTSHLVGLLNRTGNLVEAGIRPVFVFDGAPHALKSTTLAQRAARKEAAQRDYEAAVEAGDLETARSKAQQTSRLTAPMVQDAQSLLEALGVPVLRAPSEGEAQASWMAAAGRVDGVVSQDFDALLFGAPVVVRNLGVSGRRKLPGKQVWVEAPPEEVPLAESLAALHLTRAQLVDAALLVGTDFHPGVKGIGAKTAIGLIRDAGSLDALLHRLATQPATSAAERKVAEQAPDLAGLDEVRQLFLQPAHDEAEVDLALRAPDTAAVERLLVDRHGFAPERVRSALAKYQAARRPAQQKLF